MLYRLDDRAPVTPEAGAFFVADNATRDTANQSIAASIETRRAKAQELSVAGRQFHNSKLHHCYAPSNPTDTQTLGCLRRSGSLCYVNLTMRGSRTCTSCATPGFFFYKRKFFFFELEFRFTTAVFCLTHFLTEWPLLSSDSRASECRHRRPSPTTTLCCA